VFLNFHRQGFIGAGTLWKRRFCPALLNLAGRRKKGVFALLEALQNGELERVESVVEPGEFSIPGGGDFWSVQEENPAG